MLPPGEPPTTQVDWRDGLDLLVEIVTPGGVETMCLPLAESEPGEGFNIAAGLSWGQLEDPDPMNLMMEAGGFDQCSFGACHLRRASDEKTCRLTYPLEESKKMCAPLHMICSHAATCALPRGSLLVSVQTGAGVRSTRQCATGGSAEPKKRGSPCSTSSSTGATCSCLRTCS